MLSFLVVCYPIGKLLWTVYANKDKEKGEEDAKKAIRMGFIFFTIGGISLIWMLSELASLSDQGIEDSWTPLMWSLFLLLIVYGGCGVGMVMQGRKYENGGEFRPYEVNLSEEPSDTEPSLEDLLAVKPVDSSQKSTITSKVENFPGDPPQEMECPNCGALNMVKGSAGECEYCGSRLTMT